MGSNHPSYNEDQNGGHTNPPKDISPFGLWWNCVCSSIDFKAGRYENASPRAAWHEATRQATARHAEDLALCAEQATRVLEQDREGARLDAVRIADLEGEVAHHREIADGWKAEAKRCASQLAQALEMDQEHTRLANERLAAEQAKVAALEARLAALLAMLSNPW